MDTDFANMFVQKQRDLINEMVVKVLMLETQAALNEKKMNDAVQLVTQLQSKVTELDARCKESTSEAERFKKDAIDRNRTIEQLSAARASLETQVKTLRGVVSTGLAQPTSD
jgi:chromosome segregation ATPase